MVLRSKLGWALWKAGAMVRQVVVVVRPGTAGIDTGDEPCGCRGSGKPNSSLWWLWKNGASSYVIYTMQ